jgi:TonB family protein
MNTRLTSVYALAAALSLAAPVSMPASDPRPVPVSQCAPQYPHALRHAEVEGNVVVSYTVTAQGNVANAVVVSSTDKASEHATLAAIRQWKFTPVTKDGVAVSTPVRQTINFQLPYLHAENATSIASAGANPIPSTAREVAANR